jgi:serine/threonine protein kinase
MAQLKRPTRLVRPPPALRIPDSPRTPTPTLEGYSAELSIKSQKDLVTLAILGRGNSAFVEKCRHTLTQKLVACKRITFTSDEEFQRQVIKEVALLSNSRCQQIVRLYTAFVQETQIFIVMELMDKGSLKEALDVSGSLSEAVIGQLAYQVLQGLDYLHTQMKVVHRDIKPSNLLINSQGLIKISDFGICCDSTSRACSFTGTASYMSVKLTQPERFDTLGYSADSDIWSLGVTLLECAFGRFPYASAEDSGRNLWALIENICKHPTPTPPGASAEFIDFIAICLGKEPGSRSSCRALLSHDFILKHLDNREFLDWVDRLPNK